MRHSCPRPPAMSMFRPDPHYRGVLRNRAVANGRRGTGAFALIQVLRLRQRIGCAAALTDKVVAEQRGRQPQSEQLHACASCSAIAADNSAVPTPKHKMRSTNGTAWPKDAPGCRSRRNTESAAEHARGATTELFRLPHAATGGSHFWRHERCTVLPEGIEALAQQQGGGS